LGVLKFKVPQHGGLERFDIPEKGVNAAYLILLKHPLNPASLVDKYNSFLQKRPFKSEESCLALMGFEF
jgi:hypothetical protein